MMRKIKKIEEFDILCD